MALTAPNVHRFAGPSVQNANYHNDNWDLFFDGNAQHDVAHTSIPAAVAYMGGSDRKTLFVSASHRITSSMNIPSNISVEVSEGGLFDLASGVTLTINGPFAAGPYRVFTGAGTVAFSRLVDTFFPQWWGAVGDGTTNDTAALDAAFTAVDTYGGTIIFPKSSSSYLISDDTGIRNGATPVRVVGNGSKIKRDVTASGYNMFRFRSNMIIEDLELEGYIASGTGESNVVPQNGFGFRSGPGANNVLLINCVAHNCSFDGFLIQDEEDGGHVILKNCSGYDNYRNDYACVRANYAEIDGGIWGDDAVTVTKNTSIDFEEDLDSPLHVIRRAVVRNITCYHKVGFSGIMGVSHEGEVNNVIFDGTTYGSTCGLFWTNYKVMRVGYVEHNNGAEPLWMGAVPWLDRRITGRFVLAYRGQVQANNLMPLNSHLQSSWTAYSNTGGATLVEGSVIGDRKGIRLHNGGGGGSSNYLQMTLAVTVGETYSFGCLMREDDGSVYNTGLWIVCNGSGFHPFRNGTTSEGQTERICGALEIPAGTTSLDLFIGSTSTDPYDITFADVYFCKGLFDNEAIVFPNLYLSPDWENLHTFKKGLRVRGGHTDSVALRVDADIVGAGGETSLALADIAASGNQSIVTQNATISYSVVAGLIIGDPVITKGGTDTIAVAAALAILNTPTEGTENYALYIANGDFGIEDDIVVKSLSRLFGDVVLGGDLTIRRSVATGYLVLCGGNSSSSGANLIMIGGSHATAAGDWTFRSGSTDRLAWDESATTLALTGSLTVSGNLSVTGNIIRSVQTGITASTTQTQGQQPLTKDFNYVTVVANPNDTATLPSAVAGLQIKVYNQGANSLQIFPASGDAIDGAAVDASVTLTAGTSVVFEAQDGTNWNT